jgi:hypothetical protein
MLEDCTTNEQKAYIINNMYESVCNELANIIKQKDASSMSSIVEIMSEMMPYMSQEMITKMPSMMIAVLNLIKT